MYSPKGSHVRLWGIQRIGLEAVGLWPILRPTIIGPGQMRTRIAG
jgi:hypothetical protein